MIQSDDHHDWSSKISKRGVTTTLVPPSLKVVLSSQPIVICNFLGENALPSLVLFVLHLLSVYAASHPLISILHMAEPSAVVVETLGTFKQVVRSA